jgi:hypothetical protein
MNGGGDICEVREAVHCGTRLREAAPRPLGVRRKGRHGKMATKKTIEI